MTSEKDFVDCVPLVSHSLIKRTGQPVRGWRCLELANAESAKEINAWDPEAQARLETSREPVKQKEEQLRLDHRCFNKTRFAEQTFRPVV